MALEVLGNLIYMTEIFFFIFLYPLWNIFKPSGLLAITIGCGEKSRELYKEAAPVLSEALNTESQPQKLKLVCPLYSYYLFQIL